MATIRIHHTFPAPTCQSTNAKVYRVSVCDLSSLLQCSYRSGLLLIQSLLPKQTQWALLSRLLHDALADRRHKTNVNAHYDLPYDLLGTGKNTETTHGGASTQMQRARSSFFSISPNSKDLIQPLNSTIHKPYTLSQFLCKKLRWIDLGGQYDWTEKIYHTENAPPFPSDIAKLLRSFFPNTHSEVAIVNVYSPGDTLSIHRDVSETSTNGLISVSLGCDGIFIVGLKGEDGQMNNVAIRLRSGDAIYMSRSARYAWHGVPQIIPGTCPAYLSDWPAKSPSKMAPVEVKESNYEAWRGWMSTKRINLNIRQLNP